MATDWASDVGIQHLAVGIRFRGAFQGKNFIARIEFAAAQRTRGQSRVRGKSERDWELSRQLRILEGG